MTRSYEQTMAWRAKKTKEELRVMSEKANKRFRARLVETGLPPQYRLKKYGLTMDEYKSMLKTQRSRCKICRQQVALVIDHNHKTNKARGLLCRKCNASLGGLQDSPRLLRLAADYVESYA